MKKTIIFLLATLIFFAACVPAASQNGSPRPTAKIDEVPTKEPAQTDNSEETAEPVKTPEPAETEEPASPTPEPEAYKPRDEFEQLIFDSYQYVNDGDFYAWANYQVRDSYGRVARMIESRTGLADGAYYTINFIHEVDNNYANGIYLNMERYAIVKNNLPMPDYLEDDSLMKTYFVCVKKTPKEYGIFKDYYVHADYLCVLVNVDGQWMIYDDYCLYKDWNWDGFYFDPHTLYENDAE